MAIRIRKNDDIMTLRRAELLCRGFMVFLLTLLALMYNFAAVLIGTILSSEISVASCFFAALYMVIGVPGAWYTWCAHLTSAILALPAIFQSRSTVSIS